MGKAFRIKEALKIALMAFREEMRDKQKLRWAAPSEEYSAEIRGVVRAAATAAFGAGHAQALREAADVVRLMRLVEHESGGPYAVDLLEKAAAAIEALAKP